MHLSTPVILALLYAVGVVAETCIASSAVSWEAVIAAAKNKTSGSSSGSGSSSASDALNRFNEDEATRNRIAASNTASTYNTIGTINASNTRKRATLNCITTTEGCFSTSSGGLFCYNFKNADIHDAEGTVGNLLTGDYTLADGRKWNMNKGPMPTGSSTVRAPSATASVKSGSAAATVSGTAAAAVASAKATAGAGRLEIGAGAVIVGFGMLLL